MPFPKPKLPQPEPRSAVDIGSAQPDAKQGFQFPPDHQPGMQVPKGGSSCASCSYLGEDGASCTNDYFIQWNGSPQLPNPADEYCSDWYEPKTLDSGAEEMNEDDTQIAQPEIGVADEQGG